MNDAYIHYSNNIDPPKLHTFPFGSACSFSVKAADKEGPNEDSLALIPFDSQRGLIAIADGLGGHARGDEASRITIDTLSNALAKHSNGQPDLRDVILRAIDDANRKILSLEIGAATTVIVLEILGDNIRTYHAGDSIALVTGQKGKLKFQTISHSPVGYALESGLINEAEAMEADDRHIVSNIVGCPNMRIEMGPQLKLANRDTVLLASDGLTDNLIIENIVELIRKGSIMDAATRLMKTCIDRMHQPDGHMDDLTAILFRPLHR